MLVHQRVWVPFCSISGRELSSTRTEHLDRFIEPTGDPFLPIRGPPCLFRSHSSMAVSEVNSRILAFDWIDCSHIPLSRQTFGEFLNDGGHPSAGWIMLNLSSGPSSGSKFASFQPPKPSAESLTTTSRVPGISRRHLCQLGMTQCDDYPRAPPRFLLAKYHQLLMVVLVVLKPFGWSS